jgi:uncharacterized protein with ParB-like and HNH nuclease domain
MSNIANNIVAQQKMLGMMFTDTRYRVDVFQRDFRWQHKQIDALISDLTSSFYNSYKNGDTLAAVRNYDCYYMGPVVLCDNDGEMSVVDGQQRLTSFSLLFIYLRHLQRKLKLEDVNYRELNNYIFVLLNGKRTFSLDVPARKKVMDYLYKDAIHTVDFEIVGNNENDRESNTNIMTCYDDICHIFPREIQNEQVLPLFIEWLVTRVVLVEIKASDMDNAYTIFETMNDRGLSLNPTEILKAHLLSKITDEDRREEMNLFWKGRISDIKFKAGSEGDLAFFRAWFRAKYAETIKKGQSGEEMEDFEQIGSRFQNWFKNNQKRMHLTKSDDYYNFVKGDFDFFSTQYMDIIDKQHTSDDEESEEFYITACFPMADSLMMPLMMAPVMARDSVEEIGQKLRIVNHYADVFINRRSMLGKSVNQSTIRRKIFEIVKGIRNQDIKTLKDFLLNDLGKLETGTYLPVGQNLSQNYSHYVLARIWYAIDNHNWFDSLLRTRRQASLIITQIFSYDEWEEYELGARGISCWSIVNYCLCKRNMVKDIPADVNQRLAWLKDNGCLPEMEDVNMSFDDFVIKRTRLLEEIVSDIWKCEI